MRKHVLRFLGCVFGALVLGQLACSDANTKITFDAAVAAEAGRDAPMEVAPSPVDTKLAEEVGHAD